MIQTQTIDIGHVEKVLDNCPNFDNSKCILYFSNEDTKKGQCKHIWICFF